MNVYKDRVIGKNEKVTVDKTGNVKYFNCFAEKRVENMEQLKEFESTDGIFFRQNLLELAKTKEDLSYILEKYGVWYNYSNFFETVKEEKIDLNLFGEITEEEMKKIDTESQKLLKDLYQAIIFGHDKEMKNVKENYKILVKILDEAR